MTRLIRIGLGITVFSLFLLLSACGHKKNPTGGEKDTIPPKILSVNPPEYSQLTENIKILFSKPIEKSSILTGISIYPPILKKKYIWDDELLTIKILEPLSDSTNYYFKFSNSIKDFHQNRLDKNYTFIFYNGKLQEYSIYGAISYEKKEDENKKILMSLFSNDSTLVQIKKISGNNYKLDYLNPGKYFIRAFIDKNKNNKYDFEEEPFDQIAVSDSNNTKANISLVYADTTKPKLSKINVISNTEIRVGFSEDIKKIGQINIASADSNSINLPIINQKLSGDMLDIITANQDTANYLFKINDIMDLKGNVTDFDSLFFNYSAIKDTIPPEVINISPKNGAVVISHHPKINVKFSEMIKTININLVNNETGKKYDLKLLASDKDEYSYTTKKILLNYTSYSLKISAFDYAGNKMKLETEFIIMEEK